LKKSQKIKRLVLIAVAVLLLGAYLIYSRPMTLPQMYPMLTPDKCTEIRGYYKVGKQPEQTNFVVSPEDEAFQALWDLFYGRTYCRNLRSILVRGMRSHRTEPDDFQWDVHLCFEDVALPDGNFGSGVLLRVQNWYGELDMYFLGEHVSFHTKDETVWGREVLDLIR